MKTLAAVVGLFTFSLLSSGAPPKAANDTQLPAAPSGYRWERFTEVQSAFLCPNGWHMFHKAGKSSHTYVLSVESVATNGSVETGMTVQAVKGLLDKKGMPPSVFALQMAQDTLEKKENRKLSSQDLSSGPFKAFGVRYRNEPAVAKPIIVHQVSCLSG